MKLLLLALGLFAYSATIECAPLEPSVLDNDLMEFDRLYPKKDMDKIFKKYAYQIHVAYNYLKKPEFADQLQDIEKMMEFQSVLKYLQESKLDVYKMFNAINEQLGIDIHFPMADGRKVITGTLVDMMNEMKNLVPKEKIYALYKSKMETSPDYANFVKRLHASEFKDLSMSFMNNAKTKFFIKSAHKNGVPFVKFLEFNAYHYGLLFDDEDVEEEEVVTEAVTVPAQEIAARSLQDDLDSFKALIPAVEIEELFYDYLMNDKEFQEMLEYVTSDEFKSLVKEVEDMPEVRKGLDFLVEAGIPAYDMVNKINAYLEMDKIRPLLMKTSYGGLRGFLDKVKKMIPMDKMKELYENKLATSTDFAALVAKLKSEESQQLVNKLMMNEKFQELLKKAQERGVHVQEVFKFLQDVLGLKFPAMPNSRGIETKNLGQDFLDFVKLIPMGEIKNLVETYMYEDEEFQEAMGYVFSDDFKTIVKYVEKMPEFENFLNYMEEKGVPAREIMDRVNDVFDIEFDSQENANFRKIKGGLKGFVKDMKKLLPMKDLKMLYKEKMANSEDFQDFMMRMRSQQTKDFVKKVLAHPKVQELIVKLNDKGIKIDLSMLSM